MQPSPAPTMLPYVYRRWGGTSGTPGSWPLGAIHCDEAGLPTGRPVATWGDLGRPGAGGKGNSDLELFSPSGWMWMAAWTWVERCWKVRTLANSGDLWINSVFAFRACLCTCLMDVTPTQQSATFSNIVFQHQGYVIAGRCRQQVCQLPWHVAYHEGRPCARPTWSFSRPHHNWKMCRDAGDAARGWEGFY